MKSRSWQSWVVWAVEVVVLAGPVLALSQGPSTGRLVSNHQKPDLNAQPAQIKLEHLSVEDGLSNAFDWDILQDRQGFL